MKSPLLPPATTQLSTVLFFIPSYFLRPFFDVSITLADVSLLQVLTKMNTYDFYCAINFQGRKRGEKSGREVTPPLRSFLTCFACVYKSSYGKLLQTIDTYTKGQHSFIYVVVAPLHFFLLMGLQLLKCTLKVPICSW